MKIKKADILGVLKNPVISGNRGWYLSDCPFCGKENHMGVVIGNHISSFVCFKCGEKGLITKLLKYIKRLDIISNEVDVDLDKPLENKLNIRKEVIDLDYSMPTKSKPVGFTRIYYHPYLDKRGFTDSQYEKYKIGVTKIEFKLKDSIIFVLEENHDCKGYLSRSLLDKDVISSYNDLHKEIGDGKKILRYQNSLDTDFSKTFFGINEIEKGKTDTVVIVEGIFKKFNIERILGLDNSVEVKCIASFGKKISGYQIARLQDLDVKNVILIYDPDAITQSKRYSQELSNYFSVSVGFAKKDPDEMNSNDVFELIDNLESPNKFSNTKIAKKQLK